MEAIHSSAATDEVVEETYRSAYFSLGVSLQYHSQKGAVAGADATFEGKRWGARLTLSYITAPSEDDDSKDSITLFDGHVSYAFLASPIGRLRVEVGFASAFAPDVSFLAPNLGLSGSVGLAGPLSFEASCRYAPWPFQKIDATAGLAITLLDQIAIRVGWRHLWLDDRGVLGGVRHTDTFTGPYLGAALAF